MEGSPAGGRVRLGDVARVAGVSAQTVSNVMNGRPGHSDETRRRVLAAIESTGYHPNRAAQNLRSRRARQIGFHLTRAQMDVRNPFTLTLLRHLVHAATPVGYRVVVLTQGEATSRSFREEARARDVDGFVLSDCDVEDDRVAQLHDLGVPFVVMGRTPPGLPQTWVDVDNRTAMAGVVDYLAGKGHRSFGYVGYTGPQFWALERREATRERLAARGIDLDDRSVVATSPDDLRGDIREFLERPGRPSAIITGSDSIAVVVVNVAHALGLEVGRDLAVTGFDGCALDAIVSPRLTTVRIPVADVAEAIVDRFVRLVEDGEADDAGLILPTTLQIGGTA